MVFPVVAAIVGLQTATLVIAFAFSGRADLTDFFLVLAVAQLVGCYVVSYIQRDRFVLRVLLDGVRRQPLLQLYQQVN